MYTYMYIHIHIVTCTLYSVGDSLQPSSQEALSQHYSRQYCRHLSLSYLNHFCYHSQKNYSMYMYIHCTCTNVSTREKCYSYSPKENFIPLSYLNR